MILLNPQPFQSDDLRFISVDPELFLKPCCVTGNAIPYVFSKSRRGFRVSRWKIKALLGGACGLTIQLDKLSFPCNLNILAQNFNHTGLHKHFNSLGACGVPEPPSLSCLNNSALEEKNEFEYVCASPSYSHRKLLQLLCVIWDNDFPSPPAFSELPCPVWE